MIRDRRPEDLDVLCAEALRWTRPPGVGTSDDLRRWLEADDATAVRSWVYDMAPVHVAPTRNLVAHVQLYRPTETSSTPDLAAAAGRPVTEVLAIGRLLVKPQEHDGGIARHVLKEARTHAQRAGMAAVLDLRANTFLTEQFCARHGWVGLVSEAPGAAPMAWDGRNRGRSPGPR